MQPDRITFVGVTPELELLIDSPDQPAMLGILLPTELARLLVRQLVDGLRRKEFVWEEQ